MTAPDNSPALIPSPPHLRLPVDPIDLDRALHSFMAQLTQGISPASLTSAYLDWLVHLAISPGRQMRLVADAQQQAMRLVTGAPGVEPLPQDRRFDAPGWQQWPFNVMSQAFLLNEQWWQAATTGVEGVTAHHERVVNFFSRQWLDMLSPSNFLISNPEVLAETARSGGTNLWRGAHSRIADVLQMASGAPPPGLMAHYRPGHEVAVTPGKVALRNGLMELIQYAPQTPTVHAEPLLIVPSWIMKYYILDLSPHNSLVRYLVERGHTVFMISWKNPGSEDRNLGMDDYLKLGVMAATDAVAAACPKRKIHALGYCLGGTLLSIAAAYMARERDPRLKSMTLLASEVDFTEPGELALFIDESQLAYVDDLMAEKGYLDGRQMAGAFALLNSRDLVWSRIEHEYLMGRSQPVSDLIAWNADATRMPCRQHHEYLQLLYLRNELAEGRYLVDGKPVALTDIQMPLFVLGTQRDTVSPWHSVFKIHLLSDAEISFCLCTGGHNVGVVNPPGPGVQRSYQLATRKADGPYVDPGSWAASAPAFEGSWWPAWQTWLGERSGKQVAPPTLRTNPLGDAPGSYVLAS